MSEPDWALPLNRTELIALCEKQRDVLVSIQSSVDGALARRSREGLRAAVKKLTTELLEGPPWRPS